MTLGPFNLCSECLSSFLSSQKDTHVINPKPESGNLSSITQSKRKLKSSLVFYSMTLNTYGITHINSPIYIKMKL